MHHVHDRERAIATARELQHTEAGRAFIRLLQAEIEHCKEVSVGKPMDQVAHYHGAVLRLRELLSALSREARTTKPSQSQITGGF